MKHLFHLSVLLLLHLRVIFTVAYWYFSSSQYNRIANKRQVRADLQGRFKKWALVEL